MNLNFNNRAFVAWRKSDVASNISSENGKQTLRITDYGYISGPFETKEEVIQNVEDHDFWDEGTELLLLEVRIIDQVKLMHDLFHNPRCAVKSISIYLEVINTFEFTKS